MRTLSGMKKPAESTQNEKKTGQNAQEGQMIGFRAAEDVSALVNWGMRATGLNRTELVQEAIRQGIKLAVKKIQKEREEVAKTPPGESN